MGSSQFDESLFRVRIHDKLYRQIGHQECIRKTSHWNVSSQLCSYFGLQYITPGTSELSNVTTLAYRIR